MTRRERSGPAAALLLALALPAAAADAVRVPDMFSPDKDVFFKELAPQLSGSKAEKTMGDVLSYRDRVELPKKYKEEQKLLRELSKDDWLGVVAIAGSLSRAEDDRPGSKAAARLRRALPQDLACMKDPAASCSPWAAESLKMRLRRALKRHFIRVGAPEKMEAVAKVCEGTGGYAACEEAVDAALR